MNKVTVKIQGLEFTLKGAESDEYLIRIGQTVDELLGEMMKSNSKLNVSTAAILNSCNLVDSKFKLEKEIASYRQKEKDEKSQRSELEQEISVLRNAVSENEKKIAGIAKEESNELRKKDEELTKLQNEIKLLEDSVREYRDDNEGLSKANKELKFELQSYKYKVLDLQNKLFENQMNITRENKEKKDTEQTAK